MKDVKFPDNLEISDACKDFITQMMIKDPIKRLNHEGILKHPWFSELDLLKLEKKEIEPPFKPDNEKWLKYFDD